MHGLSLHPNLKEKFSVLGGEIQVGWLARARPGKLHIDNICMEDFQPSKLGLG